MNFLGRIFLSGLAAVVPIALTIALLMWLGINAEQFLGRAVRFVLPEAWAFPGLGLILGVALVFGIGILMQLWMFRQLLILGEVILGRIPVVKTVYGAIKDVMYMVSGGEQKHDRTGKPVIVRIPGRPEALIGFLTRDSVHSRYGGDEDMVAVYLPMSYQIGGYTLLLPRTQVEHLEIDSQEALRFVLTAGMGVSEKSRNEENLAGKKPQPPQ
jgi:uncharacterized membrane protein